jgi:hypothetical protein
VLIFAVICERGSVLTVVFQSGFATLADPTGIDHAAYSDLIPNLELAYVLTDFGDAADDFVARYDRIRRVGPLVACGVQIGVTDAAIKNVDLNIFRAGLAALEGQLL